MNSNLSIKGKIKIFVLDNGRIIHEREWQKNLLLDQGLNKLSTKTFAELFDYCAKGTGGTPTKEVISGTYTLATATITRVSGSRDFTVNDIGKIIRNQDGQESIVTAFTDATHVDVRAVGTGSLTNYTAKTITFYHVNQTELDAEVDRTGTYSSISGQNSTTDTDNERAYKRTFLFDAEPENTETLAGTAISWAGTNVTKTTGRDFVTADIGKYIEFNSTKFAKIVSITSINIVVVDRSDTVAPQVSVTLYGFNEYTEIGFSDIGTAGTNLNVRVRLEDGGGTINPVVLLGENPETQGQQLSCTYELTVTLLPSGTTGATAAPITDPGNTMSGNKNFTSAIEALALSRVDTNGETSTGFAGLEPSIAPFLGMSPSLVALDPFDSPDRTAGATSVAMASQTYVADSFRIVQAGTFGLNQGNANNWRTIGLVDSESNSFLFSMLFQANQAKTGDKTLTLSFVKSWSRDLS